MDRNRARFRPAMLAACALALLALPAASKEEIGTRDGGGRPAGSSGGTVSGRLFDVSGPITSARVVLQTFQDEKCVKLFLSRKYSEGKARELGACSHELPPVAPDGEGRYRFDDVPAGWYALLVMWDMSEKPRAVASMFQKGDFIISYFSGKDPSGRFDGMAQGKPFYFSGQGDLGLDFDYRKGNISKTTGMGE